MLDSSENEVTDGNVSVDEDVTDDELMDIKEAAQYLRCAVSTVYRDTALGAIPCIHKGRRVLFLKSDLLTWLKGMRSTESGGAA